MFYFFLFLLGEKALLDFFPTLTLEAWNFSSLTFSFKDTFEV
jgi:hypothetical protein